MQAMRMRMRMESISVVGMRLCDVLKLLCWGVVDGERMAMCCDVWVI
jgi:hypothetical protein